MKILIDNGHGVDTPGKCSPDRRLLEWRYARETARAIVGELNANGLDAELLVTEDRDIPLSVRIARVNNICSRLGADNVVLVSVHVNAAGADGRWHEARGWSGWVCRNASSNARKLASMLYDRAVAMGLKGNRAVTPDKYWTADFAILRNTRCAAVLTENLFQDNLRDVDLLLSPEGRKKIVALHVEAISAFAAAHVQSAKSPGPKTLRGKVLHVFGLLAISASLFSAAGCTKKIYVPLESRSVASDTLFCLQYQRDTLLQRDSVYVIDRGDTLREFRFRERIHFRERVDTVYASRCDTLIVDRPVTIDGPSPASGTLRFKDRAKGAFLGIFLSIATLCVWIVRKKIRSKN